VAEVALLRLLQNSVINPHGWHRLLLLGILRQPLLRILISLAAPIQSLGLGLGKRVKFVTLDLRVNQLELLVASVFRDLLEVCLASATGFYEVRLLQMLERRKLARWTAHVLLVQVFARFSEEG